MTQQGGLWEYIIAELGTEDLLAALMARVAHGLSEIVEKTIVSEKTQLRTMSAAQRDMSFRDPNEQVVGIYLQIGGALRGQAILILPMVFALNLAEFMLKLPRGSTARLGPVERSALAEVGNLTISYFLNAIALLTDGSQSLRPSTPVVMTNTRASILNMITSPVGGSGDELKIIESTLRDAARTIQAHFWVLPHAVKGL